MRFLLALAICILALTAGHVSAREMAGLRRLSASDADASAPVPSTSNRSGAAASARSLPEITLYGEALCPDTAAFVSKVLSPLIDAGAVVQSGSKAAKAKATPASLSAAPSAPSPSSISFPSSSTLAASSLPLASQPGGGFLSAHSGGPAPTEISASKPSITLGGGSAGSVTINSAAASSSSADEASATAAAPSNTPAATFRFVAWGKAKRSADGKAVVCQHGPKECELNKLLECAQAKQQGAGTFPATLRCYFAALGKAGGGTPSSLEACVNDKATFAKISSCAAGSEGAALETAAGKETEKQLPALTFVPWVVVDGKQLAGECGSALKAACESSKAKGVSPLSPACSRLPELTTKGCPGFY